MREDCKMITRQNPVNAENAIEKASALLLTDATTNVKMTKTINPYEDLATRIKKHADDVVKRAEEFRIAVNKYATELISSGKAMDEYISSEEDRLNQQFDHLHTMQIAKPLNGQ
jgi:uncharacterized coiled-coil DUF342 family protein